MPTDPGNSVSVALCTFNGRRWIAKQIRSVLAQTIQVDEIVVSDDASQDDTVAIVRQVLEEGDIPFRILESPHQQGFVANFEKAVRHCSGDLVFFCDQDDLWEPEKVSSSLELMQGHLWFASDARLISADDAILPSRLWERIGFDPGTTVDSASLSRRILRRPTLTGATMAVRRDALELCLPFPTEFPHDHWISLVLSVSGHAPALSSRQLVRYRLHEAQQIGLKGTSLQAQLDRGLKTTSSSYREEVRLCQILLDRLPSHAPHSRMVIEKIRHMETRAEMGNGSTVRRIFAILQEMYAGRYRYSWTGLAPLKDLIRPCREIR